MIEAVNLQVAEGMNALISSGWLGTWQGSINDSLYTADSRLQFVLEDAV